MRLNFHRWTTVGAKGIAEVSLRNHEKHMDGPQGFDVLTHFILISKVSMIPEFWIVEIPEMLREPF